MQKQWQSISIEEAKQHALYGVKGWLAVFCVGMFLGLSRNIAEATREANQLGLTISQFIAVDPSVGGYLKSVFALDVLIALVMTWSLFTKHHSFRLALTGILLGYWPALALFASLTSAIQIEGMPSSLAFSMFPWLASCIVWVTYLHRSQRVRVTFENTVLTTQVDAASASPPRPPPQTRPTTAVVNTPPPFKPVPQSAKLTITAPMSVPSQKTITVSEDAIEDIWARALAEYQGSDRKPGLWAKCYAEADGNEALAQATYLKTRAAQLEAELRKKLQLENDAREQILREQELAKLSAEELVDYLLPKGKCPNGRCNNILPLAFTECPKCGATFGGLGWELIPVDPSQIDADGQSWQSLPPRYRKTRNKA
jgi:Protein of unknown function (DUF2569)